MTDLRAVLHYKKYGNAFDFPLKKLGDVLMDIDDHNYRFPKDAIGENDYPTFPSEELPSDVVKGILQMTKRPYIVIRYALAEQDIQGQYVAKITDKVVAETFFQRHSTDTVFSTTIKREILDDGTPHVTIIPLTTSGLDLTKEEEKELKSDWITAEFNNNRPIHYSGSLTDEHWQVLKNILEAKPLEETVGRYLPCYQDLYLSPEVIKV